MMDPDGTEESVEWWRTRLDKAQVGATALGAKATARLAALRGRSQIVDVGMRIYERDKHAAGTLLGSALALRLFLFFLPFTLVSAGLAGLLGLHAGVNGVSSSAGISGSISEEIDQAFAQSGRSSFLALLIGLYFLVWTGRSLTRALVLSSALGWGLSGKQKTPVRLVGVVVGVLVGTSLIWALLNRVRQTTGLAVASVSFVAVALAYVVLWSLLFLTLPRATKDPGAALPGASVVALTLSGLQAISMLYVPNAISNASSLYGTLGITVTLLGWFFFIGRAMSFGFAMNAVIYERVGSVSQLIFALPILRAIPRRFPAFRTFFDLPDQPAKP